MALAGPGCVLEVALQRDAVVAHPGVGELASGAIAAAGASAVLRVRDAVHESLRGDAGRGARVLDELRLQGLGGGDGPAAAAIALIPHFRAAVDVQAAGGAGHGLVARGVQAVHALGAAAQEGGASATGAAARGLVAVEGGSLGLVPIHKGVHARLPKAALLGVPGIRGPNLGEGGFEKGAAAAELLGAHLVVPAEVLHVLLERVSLQLRPRSALPQCRRIAATQEDCADDSGCCSAVHAGRCSPSRRSGSCSATFERVGADS
mmetsp:Transcript_80416/g.217960  ORF Transcript_80416/g.217960 Transcript_80416/m.217960 type:complete len:263 (+) Transcript_80416:722-1510(+)